MNTNFLSLIIVALSLTCLGIYLFVSAPPPLDLNVSKVNKSYSTENAFKIIAKLNDDTRTFYTKEIVGKGMASGLKFHEDWQKSNVEAGPLPALFLRGIAQYIEKSAVPMGLYLGSDFPIVQANLFEGVQAEKFKEIKKDKKPKFFYDTDTDRHIGMFPDFAGAQACVTCHNEHKDSPKKNWKLNDMMGATTWSYPTDSISTDELLAMISIYKNGVKNTYTSYITEVNGFKSTIKPNVGNNWPSQGYNIPSWNTLSDTIDLMTSKALMTSILNK